jgi:hypothetical protein
MDYHVEEREAGQPPLSLASASASAASVTAMASV